jgi:hypothetical protein
VGEFYEGCGIDAVLLVQHAGLNPMGQGGPPRAGCPRVNLRQTVNDLVRVGLSVVVCEEVRGTRGREGNMVASGGQAWWTAAAFGCGGGLRLLCMSARRQCGACKCCSTAVC